MKLYAGSAMLDRVLVEVVAPAANRALASGVADGWFFIRYADPGSHLRVRLHGDPARLWGEVFPKLSLAAKPFIDADRIATVALDTYDREIAPDVVRHAVIGRPPRSVGKPKVDKLAPQGEDSCVFCARTKR